MGKGWIDKNGEYCESHTEPSLAEKKKMHEEKQKWFDSLPVSEREIIKWCFTIEANARNVVRFAHERMRMMAIFYRTIEKTNITPKKEIMYEHAYKHFEKFKDFISTYSEK